MCCFNNFFTYTDSPVWLRQQAQSSIGSPSSPIHSLSNSTSGRIAKERTDKQMWKILEVSTEDKLNTLDDLPQNDNSTTIQQRVAAIISATPENSSNFCSTAIALQPIFDTACKPIREYTFNYDHLDNVQMDYPPKPEWCCTTHRNKSTEHDISPNHLTSDTELSSSISKLDSDRFTASLDKSKFHRHKLILSRLTTDHHGSLINSRLVSQSDTQINICNKWILNSKLECKHKSYSIDVFNNLICQFNPQHNNLRHNQRKSSLSNPDLDSSKSFS